jgi:hydroxypyruvate reductase
MTPRQLLRESFIQAVNAAHPARVMPGNLPKPPSGRLFVVGAGKAAAAMAVCFESLWPDLGKVDGLVITRHGHGAPTRVIEVIEAGHPLPDNQGILAAQRLLDLVAMAQPHDGVLALFSGGGSSLLTLPEAGLALEELRRLAQAMLNSGAPIEDINCVRKHLSLTAGGKLARICRAPINILLISDVVGDDPSTIASGPFTADPTRFTDALAILAHWGINSPPSITDFLRSGINDAARETIKPGDPCLSAVETRIIANARTALNAAADFLRRQGCDVHILGDDCTDESRELAMVHGRLALDMASQRRHDPRPLVLLSGGETRVTVKGSGRGGRNTEYLLSLALQVKGHPRLHALAADTDGIDGSEDNAGAMLGPDTWRRAEHLGLEASRFLEDNDAYGYFSRLDELLVTGPTRTNVNDYRAILIT